MLDLLKVIVLSIAGLVALMLVLLALPHSKFRAVVLEILGWTGTVASTTALVSPIDLLPDVVPIVGQLDDLGYLVIGMLCAVLAYTQHKSRRPRTQRLMDS